MPLRVLKIILKQKNYEKALEIDPKYINAIINYETYVTKQMTTQKLFISLKEQ